MNILAINCGSASVKYKCFAETTGELAQLSEGAEEVTGNYEAAVELVLKGLSIPIHAVAHRVVHGGNQFQSPTIIDASVIRAIEDLSELAPLHNPPALAGIQVTSALNVPMVAVFDTSFYTELPAKSRTYALPQDLDFVRYGFHGISHQFVMERYAVLTGKQHPTIISLHLGNGCSATAILEGQAVDTSMGFTPLEGLMMGTRPGDMDVGILLHLLRHGKTISELEAMLQRESGLTGIAGTNDMRQLLGRDDERAHLAIDMFCYRIRKYVGSYLAAMNGAEAIVFTGRIGERSAEIRKRVCEGLGCFGLTLDRSLKETKEGRISTHDSKLHAYVVPTDEELLMVRETVRIINKKKD